MFETIKNLFTKKEEAQDPARNMRELLRENLTLVPIDVFYIDDPIPMKEEERKKYLKVFNDLMKEPEVEARIKYLTNKQARMTLQNHDPTTASLGSVNINGICTVLDDFKRLSDMYDKETTKVETFNKYNIL